MKLNPITVLSDLFSKLVIEHGSAVIQEKHIALLKEQFAILERENTRLTASLEKSETKNQILKTENQALKKENIQLKKKIETYEKSTHDNLLDKEQVLILQCLATLAHDKMFPLEAIVSSCNLSEQATLFHLQELEDESMIDCSYIDGIPYWSLDHDGRRYLMKHKLIS